MKTKAIRIYEDDYYKIIELSDRTEIAYVRLLSRAIKLLLEKQKQSKEK